MSLIIVISREIATIGNRGYQYHSSLGDTPVFTWKPKVALCRGRISPGKESLSNSPHLVPSGCVTLDQLLFLSESQFPFFGKGRECSRSSLRFLSTPPSSCLWLFEEFWIMIVMWVPLAKWLPGRAPLCCGLVVLEVWMPSKTKTWRMKLIGLSVHVYG